MKTVLLSRNPAKFVWLETPSGSEEDVAEVVSENVKFNKKLTEVETLWEEQKLADEVRATKLEDKEGKESDEIVPSGLKELQAIQKEIKIILDSIKELKATDYEVKKKKGDAEMPTSIAENLADRLETVGEKLDDFRERDLGQNESNTSFSHEIGNYLADIEVALREAIAFSKSAKRALDAHKDLAGLVENKIVSTEDAKEKGLIDPIFYDPELIDNPFEDDRLEDKDIVLPANFKNTKEVYNKKKEENLVYEIGNYRKLSNSLKQELAKPLEDQDKKVINDLSIDVKTSKKAIDNLKSKLKRESIPRDMVDEVYNSQLKELNEKYNKTKEELDKYEKKRTEVQKYIETEYLNTDNIEKEILSKKLTDHPYYLTKAKDLDETVRILEKYVSESQVDEKYRTDDTKGVLRKKNLLNVIGIGGKNLILEGKNVPQFEDIDEALSSLKGSQRKEYKDSITEYVNAEVISRENDGKKVTAEDRKLIKKEAGEAILKDMNLYVVYHNAEEMLKDIKEKLNIIKEDPGENDNNKKLQKERFTKLSLNESLKDHFNYEAKKLEIDNEIYDIQPALFKKSFEDWSDYYVLKSKVVNALARMNKMEELLIKSNGKDYDFENDVDYINKKEIYDNFVQKAAEAGLKVTSITNEIEASFDKVKDSYRQFADVAYLEVDNNLVNSREKKADLKEAEDKFLDQEDVVKGAKELEADMTNEHNRESVKKDRSGSDKELNEDDTFLKKQERKLLEIQRKVQELDKQLNRMRRDRTELKKLQEESVEKEK